MRNIRVRRTVILILTGLAIAVAVGIYTLVPSGIASMEIISGEGERLGEELNIYAGSETQLGCKVSPAVFMDRKTSYVSADESVASVDEEGLVKGLKTGETAITVSHAGVRRSINVKVQASVRAIEGLPDEVTLYEGDGYLLEPEVLMAGNDTETPDVVFESKRTSIAEVDTDGQIIAGETGTTTVTVSAGTISIKIPITVISRPEQIYY